MTGPRRFRAAIVRAGTAFGWAKGWTRSPLGVGTRSVSWPCTTTGAAANRSGRRSGAWSDEARARPITVSSATPRDSATKLPVKVIQRVRRVCTATVSMGRPSGEGRTGSG